MARKPKKGGNRTRSKAAAKAVTPIHYFCVDGYLLDNLLQRVIDDASPCPQSRKFIKIQLPCTLEDLAAECAEACFAVCEELAFKAGIKFLPDRPKTVVEKFVTRDEDIPF